LSIEHLKARFAEQRARGAEHQISEEEEDMILETLGQIRSGENGGGQGNGNANVRNGVASQGHEDAGDEEDSSTSREGAAVDSDYQASYERSSVRSSNTVASSFVATASSVRSSPSSRSAKRYSNNLFSSGRMRDYNYNRNQRSGGSQRSAVSIAPTESSLSVKVNSTYSDRPITPDRDGSVGSSSAQSSPMTDKTPVVRSAPLNTPSPYLEHSSSVAEYRLSKTLNPAALKRASLALEEALKEIEEEMGEEAEDEIVMPRSAPAARARYSQQSHFSGDSIEVGFNNFFHIGYSRADL
jgi:serine/arginine repetitive matrix protein 2